MVTKTLFTQTDKIALIGRSGCGKSWLGRQIQKIYPRVLIFDKLGEYPVTPNDIYNFDQFAQFVRESRDLDKFTRIVRFIPGEPNKEKLFEAYMQALYHMGDVMIVLEETQDYCTPHKIDEWFLLCMTSGRHRGLGFIFTTQRPVLINTSVYSQCTHIFVGNLINKNDGDTMASLMDRKRQDFSLLKNREFYWFMPERTPHTVKIDTNKAFLAKK